MLSFAVWAQCDFLGWQDEDHAGLAQWMQASHAATLAQDRAAHTELAAHFQAVVTAQLERRRGASTAAAPGDITCALMQEKVNGVLLTDAEIASILRNWTVGEIGTMAASAGILCDWLAHHAPVQTLLRERPSAIPAAVEEILRLRGPLATNRRVTTCPVDIGGADGAARPAGGSVGQRRKHGGGARPIARTGPVPGERLGAGAAAIACAAGRLI